MAVSYIVNNAPYAYLAKDADEKYYLYICIPYAPGTRVKLTSGANASELIAFKIEKEALLPEPLAAPDPGPKFFYYGFKLGTKEIAADRRTNIEALKQELIGKNREILSEEGGPVELLDLIIEETVSIEVQNNTNESEFDKPSYQAVLSFEDADLNDDLPSDPKVLLPYHPYLYLINPNAETGGDEDKFKAYIIIPDNEGSIVNDENLNKKLAHPNVTYDGAKEYHHKIEVKLDKDSKVESISESVEESFNKTEKINAAFTFVLNYNGKPPRKSKMRYQSAIRKPSGFLTEDQIKLKRERIEKQNALKNADPGQKLESNNLFTGIWQQFMKFFN